VAHPDWQTSGQVHRAFCDVCDHGDWGNNYFNLNGRPVAKYIGGVESWAFFFHANALASTSMITDWSGSG